jgi:predicted nucleic acid-binding protein
MILLDSNIIIYLRDPSRGQRIASQLDKQRLSTCNVIIAEVLGFKEIEAADSRYFKNLFSSMKNHMFDEAVTNKVIELRKSMNIQLPDAIIAATAITNELVLWTHNVEDFENIAELRLFDPLI